MNAPFPLPLLYRDVPRVIGTLSTPDGLANALRRVVSLPCDAVEIRCGEATSSLDQLSAALHSLQCGGKSVLLTVRNQAEGGTWRDDDPERLAWFEAGVREASAVDIETCSSLVSDVCALADTQDRPVVLSWHDFQGTPEAATLLERMQIVRTLCKNPIFKAACRINSKADMASLRRALEQKPDDLPVCLIGMGAEGAATRLEFALHGSILTYGYLDQPSAPGQFSCKTLREFMAIQSRAYRAVLVAS